jgi:MFS family permease
MHLRPSETLSETDVKKGLKLVIVEGLTAEAMTSFTGGAFLTAMALLMGAENSQIGVLAALPTFTNFSQLLSIWLVHRYNNRRAIAVICAVLARIPLIVIGMLALLWANSSVSLLLIALPFYYMFGSIAGPSWNAWMKDLIPEQTLGTYFAKRSRYMQMLNMALSLALALTIDYIRHQHPELELSTYALLLCAAGIIGVVGAFLLSKVPEPLAKRSEENLFGVLERPLKDANFKRLLLFNSGWLFALNIATPFFTVFMLTSLKLPLSYIIALGILSQLFSILTIRTWGASADRYSNKTIIAVAGPFYIACIIAWCFVGLYNNFFGNLALLAAIHIFTGATTAGINLAITNIGLKLSPNKHAVVYLSMKNIITSSFASIAPIIGGWLADYFVNRRLMINITWAGPQIDKAFRLISLQGFSFLFLIGAFLALLALELLVHVHEIGEVDASLARRIIRKTFKTNVKDFFVIETLVSWHNHVWEAIKKRLSW